MRLKIMAVTEKPCNIPYDYQYKLQCALYELFKKSDTDFSAFLHDRGYELDGQYRFKMFTFSRLKISPYHTNKQGFFLIKKIEFLFSTAVDKNLEHLMHGIFPQAEMMLNFNEKIRFNIVNVEMIQEPAFDNEKQKFICLAPIVVSTQRQVNGKTRKHYLNYFVQEERELWLQNLKTNLLRKYEVIHKKKWEGDDSFEFQFDAEYITTANRSVKKLVKMNKSNVIGLFAPFELKCDKALKKIAYDTGFGEQNSAGFGCFDLVKK